METLLASRRDAMGRHVGEQDPRIPCYFWSRRAAPLDGPERYGKPAFTRRSFDVDGFVPDIVPHPFHDGVGDNAIPGGLLAQADRFTFRRMCRMPNPSAGRLDPFHFPVHPVTLPPVRQQMIHDVNSHV